MSELSFREIGELTGINEHTVQSRIYAILDKMRLLYVKNDKGDRLQWESKNA
jgi:DNA-directed RNA polymerase specialized sigma24 family protein